MQMLTEPMSAAHRAQIKAEREAWDAMEKRISQLEAENVRLRSELDQWKGRWEGAKIAVELISK